MSGSFLYTALRREWVHHTIKCALRCVEMMEGVSLPNYSIFLILLVNYERVVMWRSS